MDRKRLTANTLRLVAKEIYAEEKPKFEELEYRDQAEAVKKARAKAGLKDAYQQLNADVYTDIENRSYKGYDIKVGINWSSLGTQNLADTKKFANELLTLIEKAKKFAEAIKKEFPGIKIEGI